MILLRQDTTPTQAVLLGIQSFGSWKMLIIDHNNSHKANLHLRRKPRLHLNLISLHIYLKYLGLSMVRTLPLNFQLALMDYVAPGPVTPPRKQYRTSSQELPQPHPSKVLRFRCRHDYLTISLGRHEDCGDLDIADVRSLESTIARKERTNSGRLRTQEWQA